MTSYIEYQCNNCGHEGLNTRAVPDVPELVRYAPATLFDGTASAVPTYDGEYVRYDQAAAVIGRYKKDSGAAIAAMVRNNERAEAAEAELADLKDDGIAYAAGYYQAECNLPEHENAKAAIKEYREMRAELAQIKAQEPVASVEYRVHEGRRVKRIYPINLDNVEAGYSLYASPAQCPDLKAENERLRAAGAPLAKFCEWYDSVDELGAFPDIQDVMVPLGVLRALRNALSGKKPT